MTYEVGSSLAIVRLSYLRGADISNKAFEWTIRHQLTASPPQAPCLPLRGRVIRLQQAVDGSRPWYREVVLSQNKSEAPAHP
jgi:hypothetical protein